MIRQFLVFAVLLLLTVGTFLGTPVAAIAAGYEQSQSASQQESQSYGEQSIYNKTKDASDYSDKQTDQTKSQEKQSNQMDANKKQYAQEKQSYENK